MPGQPALRRTKAVLQFIERRQVPQGGSYFHPTDEVQSVGTPAKEKATWRLRFPLHQLENSYNLAQIPCASLIEQVND